MYLEGFGQPPVQVDTAGAIVSAPGPDVTSAGTITVVGQRPLNWVPWVIAAGLAIALLIYLAQQQRGRDA
jgi:hypothetical protein